MPTSIEVPRLWYAAEGGVYETADYPEAASQAFKKGDLVYLVSGKVTIAAAAGAQVGNITILGVAEQDASGTTDTPIRVALADANLRIVLPIYHSTPASAVVAITDIAKNLPLINVTGYGFCADLEHDGTNDRVNLVSLHPGPGKLVQGPYSKTEQYGWYVCKFIDTNTVVGA